MKRKMYAKRETKWHKRTRQNKKTLLLYALVGVSCIINLQGAYDTYKARQELIRYNESFTTAEIMDYQEIDTIEWVLNEVEKEGFNRYDVYNLIYCESRWNTQAINVNNGGSVDMGLWQINNKYHSEVSPICNYEYQCQTQEAIRILKERGYKEWQCGKILGLN